MRENRTYSLSGGRWPVRKRATSDPTPMKPPNKGANSGGGGGGKGGAQREHRPSGKIVKPDDGYFERHKNGWRVQLVACKYKEASMKQLFQDEHPEL
jgi:hypothetical protein